MEKARKSACAVGRAAASEIWPPQAKNGGGKMTDRTVIQSNGKPVRFVLRQPPHFRTGQNSIAPQIGDADRRTECVAAYVVKEPSPALRRAAPTE